MSPSLARSTTRAGWNGTSLGALPGYSLDVVHEGAHGDAGDAAAAPVWMSAAVEEDRVARVRPDVEPECSGARRPLYLHRAIYAERVGIVLEAGRPLAVISILCRA